MYEIKFQARTIQIDADDDLHAAHRAIATLLMDGAIKMGASYEVTVDGRAIVVDVAEKPGRGAIKARYA